MIGMIRVVSALDGLDGMLYCHIQCAYPVQYRVVAGLYTVAVLIYSK
jgi:hypothetical protein